MKNKIVLWQQNTNKSPTSQHNLISSNTLTQMNVDIVALQEPSINVFNCTIASKEWTAVYPTTHSKAPDKTRSTLLIRSHINTDNWNQIDFPSSDVTVIQLSGKWGKLTIFNIYNDSNSNKTINSLTKFHKNNRAKLGLDEPRNAHII